MLILLDDILSQINVILHGWDIKLLCSDNCWWNKRNENKEASEKKYQNSKSFVNMFLGHCWDHVMVIYHMNLLPIGW